MWIWRTKTHSADEAVFGRTIHFTVTVIDSCFHAFYVGIWGFSLGNSSPKKNVYFVAQINFPPKVNVLAHFFPMLLGQE